MQLVYDRFETIESNLHKAYYHFEDVDPELLDKFNEDNRDDPDIDISGYDIIATFHEGGNKARLEAINIFHIFNLYCLAGLEYDETIVDSTDTTSSSTLYHFFNNLDASLFYYIEFGVKKFDYSLLKSSAEKLEKEKAAAVVKASATKLFDLESILDCLGIQLDSTSIKKGKEILAKESALEFYEWSLQYEPSSPNDCRVQVISNPCYEFDNLTQEEAISHVHLLEYCIKKYEKEYREWKTENAGLKGRKTAIISIFDFIIGRYSLQRLFYIYYLVEGHFLDKMFYAMNAETYDGDFNRLLVEAVRNYPDPQFALEVNERYKEYKRYNPGCIDFPFVDQNAEPKHIAPPSPIEDNTHHIDVRLGKYFEVSLDIEDVEYLYHCFYQMFDRETKRGDILYYLSTGADDGLVHNGIKWQGSREGLALFLQGVLPRKKRGFWKAVYKVFRIKKNDEWVKTKDLNRIGPREWDKDKNSEECKYLEKYYNNWMKKRPDLKGQWEFKNWRKER